MDISMTSRSSPLMDFKKTFENVNHVSNWRREWHSAEINSCNAKYEGAKLHLPHRGKISKIAFCHRCFFYVISDVLHDILNGLREHFNRLYYLSSNNSAMLMLSPCPLTESWCLNKYLWILKKIKTKVLSLSDLSNSIESQNTEIAEQLLYLGSVVTADVIVLYMRLFSPSGHSGYYVCYSHAKGKWLPLLLGRS